MTYTFNFFITKEADWRDRNPRALSMCRVLICLFFILQRKIENFVGIFDHVPFASTIAPRFWFPLSISVLLNSLSCSLDIVDTT